ncbi:MAG: Asp-tRNA(Asn)/Glu-tRNA(Gln) amidotransferase subunit GatA [Elusimicrobiota bacterium]
MSIIKTVDKIRSGELSSRELLEKYLPLIEAGQEKLNSYVPPLLSEKARLAADRLDERIKAGGGEKIGRLAGIPVAIKDNMLLEGTATTCGSNILKNYNSPYTATAVQKIIDEGAVIVGKTNMDEFAMGSSGETSYFGPVKNPADINRIPGGSSSGSAAVVADKHVFASLGSDTGGSIRQPAAMCGVVGMKPTYGLVSRYGLVAFASSLDQIGPFALNVEDAALILEVIAGYDPKDSTSYNPENYADEKTLDIVSGVNDGVNGLKFGIPKEYLLDGLDPEIRSRLEETAGILVKAGAEVQEVSLPLTKYAVAVYYIVAPAEASANLARYDGVKYGLRTGNGKDLMEDYLKTRQEGFGSEVKRRIMLGTYALSSGYYDAYYLKAQKVRNLMKADFENVFSQVDMILSPTTPTTAFKIGEKTEDPLTMYLSDIYTISSNLVGIPAISIPAGTDSKGLPIGIQFMAPLLEDRRLFTAGRVIEGTYPNE